MWKAYYPKIVLISLGGISVKRTMSCGKLPFIDNLRTIALKFVRTFKNLKDKVYYILLQTIIAIAKVLTQTSWSGRRLLLTQRIHESFRTKWILFSRCSRLWYWRTPGVDLADNRVIIITLAKICLITKLLLHDSSCIVQLQMHRLINTCQAHFKEASSLRAR